MGTYKTSFSGDLARYDGDFEFRWTETKLSTPGQTKISWTLYAVGRTGYASTGLWTTAKVEVNNKQVWSINNAFQSYSNAKLANGEFTVQHKSDGSGVIPLYISVSKKYYTVNTPAIFEPTLNVTNNKPYTKCYWSSGAKASISQPYIAPGGDLKITWDNTKANAGTGVSIKEFRVEYKIGNNNWTAATSSANEKEHIFSRVAQNSQRGQSIQARVSIVSSVDGYSSDPINSGTSYVNIKPSKPVIQNYSGRDTNNMISSASTQIAFQCTRPTKSTNQTIYLCYKRDGSSDEVRVDADVFSCEQLNNENRIVIYAYDGVEYSDELDPITILKNSNELDEFQDGLKVDNENPYLVNSMVPDTESTAAVRFGYNTTIEYKINNDSTTSTISLDDNESFDVRALVGVVKSGQEYKINLKQIITDGIDKKTNEIALEFKAPVLELSAAKMDGTLVEGGYFDKYYLASLSGLEDDEGAFWNLPGVGLLEKDIPEGTQLQEIELNQNNEIGSFKMQANSALTQIQTLQLDFCINADDATLNKYKPYTQQLELIAQTPINLAACGIDGVNNLPDLSFQPRLCVNDDVWSFFTKTGGESSDGTLSYTLSQPDSYNFGVNSTSTQNSVKYRYETIFGTQKMSESSLSFGLDFLEPAQTAGGLNEKIVYEKGETAYTLETIDGIVEGMALQFKDYYVIAFSQPEIQLQYQYNGAWKNFTSAENSDKKGVSVPDAQVNDRGNVSANTYSFSNYSVVVDPILIQGERLKIRALVYTPSLTNLSEGEAEFVEVWQETLQDERRPILKRHTEPLIRFSSVEYNKPFIKAEYVLIDEGCDDTSYDLSIECVISGNDDSITGVIEEEGSVKFEYNNDNWDNIYIAPKAKITVNAKVEDEPIYFSEKTTQKQNYLYMVCYNISPTVSYRKNHIGINTNRLDESTYNQAVAVIKQHNSRNQIIFSGASRDTDDSTTQDKSATLDLTTMGLTGFIVDGGSWDGTGGGIMPRPGTENFTGEFSDLSQTNGVIIILSGGGAPGVS